MNNHIYHDEPMQLCIGTIQATIALATWEWTESRLVGSVCWRWNKTEQKSRSHNRAFPRQEVAQISVLDGTYTQIPETYLLASRQKCVSEHAADQDLTLTTSLEPLKKRQFQQ